MTDMTDEEKIELIRKTYNARLKDRPQSGDRITARRVADVLGRDDAERVALVVKLSDADPDRDLWPQWVDIWFELTKDGERDDD